jgi:drug/metabolite transporter (DMT)-like permease
MLRGMKVLITAILSIIFLKKKLYRHHWTSVAVIFLGLILVGVAVLTDKSSGGGIDTSPLGIFILLLATVFSSCLYVVEEKILGKYTLDPLKVVGLEGLWGLIMWCILLPIF